jgi:hypothetical protein
VIWIKNMMKYQVQSNPNDKIKARIEADIKNVPDCTIKRRFVDTLSIRYRYDADAIVSVSSLSSSNSVSESPGGGVGEGIPTPTEWDRRILAVYTQVTGQVAIPYDRTYQVLQDLDHILATYSDHDKAISDGKKVFSRWCNSQGANGKKYSPVNTSWLSWWLSERAPKPEVPQSSALDKALEALK